MLLKDLADAIAGNYDKKNDLEFRRRVEDLIIVGRAELIRRNIDKYGTSSSNLIEQINCLPTTQVDIAECCTVTLGCTITRTVDKVPKPIRVRNRNSNFLYVGTIDGKKSYSQMDIEELEIMSSERFFITGSATYSYINEYLYIYGDKPQHIRVKAIFNDPRDVANLNDCDGSDCVDNIEIDNDLANNIMLLIEDHLRRERIEPEKNKVEFIDTENAVN